MTTRTLSQELEVEYNNRAAIPEHPEIFKNWQTQSEGYRSQSNCRLDVAYGIGEREKLDLFLASSPKAPLYLFIHGGYWQALDKGFFSFVANALVAQDVTVVVLNYPLCPAVTLDEIAASVRMACAWCWRHGADFGANPENIHVSGHSAGGHLSAMIMSTDWTAIAPDLPKDLIKSGLSISGVFDLEPLRSTTIANALNLDDDSSERNSPISLKPITKAPLTLAVGGEESSEFHRQSNEFAQAWQQHGVPIRQLDIPQCNHFTVLEQLVEPNGVLLNAALELIGG